MPIDYTGSRPYSADVVALMRRINALEAAIPIVSILDSVAPARQLITKIASHGTDDYIYSGHHDNVAPLSSRKSIARIKKSDLSVSYLIPSGTGAGELNNIPAPLKIDFDARDGSIWIADNWVSSGNPQARLQKFNSSGALQSETKLPKVEATGRNSKAEQVFIRSDNNPIFMYWEKYVASTSPTVYGYIGGVYNTPSAPSPVISLTTDISGSYNRIVDLTPDDKIILNSVATGYNLYSSGGSLLNAITLSGVSFTGYTIIGTQSGNELIMRIENGTNHAIIVTDESGAYKRTMLSNYGAGSPPPVAFPLIASFKYFSEGVANNWWWYGTKTILKGSGETDTYDQMEFSRYPDKGALTNPESLGTPDDGVAVPALDGLVTLTNGDAHRPHYGELDDMRLALEDLAPYYENTATGNPFNITLADPDNIFTVAIDAGQDDWTTPIAASVERMRVTDLSDIDLVLEELEASDLS